MEHINHWLRVSTWRTVTLQQHAGAYTATAYDYPDLNEASRRWVFEGHGTSVEQALNDLGEHLKRLGGCWSDNLYYL